MEQRVVVPPMVEAPVVEHEVVRQTREIAAMGWGTKAASVELGMA